MLRLLSLPPRRRAEDVCGDRVIGNFLVTHVYPPYQSKIPEPTVFDTFLIVRMEIAESPTNEKNNKCIRQNLL